MAFHEMSDGTRIFYTDAGEGRPALLLHGWCCEGNDWSWQAPGLERRYRVLTVDHRGHGRSDAPHGSYRAQVLADDAADLLRTVVPGEPAVVFGHSLGCSVASALAVRHPDLVAGLVLVDPVYNLPDEVVRDAFAILGAMSPSEAGIMIYDAGFYTPETPEFLKAWHHRRIHQTPDHVITDALRALYDGDEGIGRAVIAQEYLRQRKAPRIAVYANEPATWVERALPLGDGDEIHVIEGGHFLHQQRPEEFNALAFGWLERNGLG